MSESVPECPQCGSPLSPGRARCPACGAFPPRNGAFAPYALGSLALVAMPVAVSLLTCGKWTQDSAALYAFVNGLILLPMLLIRVSGADFGDGAFYVALIQWPVLYAAYFVVLLRVREGARSLLGITMVYWLIAVLANAGAGFWAVMAAVAIGTR
jgi:hypothetical protein